MALAKLQVKIGGMACSFCVETIKKGLGRMDGVAEVNVSLAHEEALIAYDRGRVAPATLTGTLRSLGYTVRDPKKARTFEEEEAELQRERDRLIIAGAAAWMGFVVMLLMWVGRHHPWAHWFMAALALVIVFGPGFYILRMAWASARRGILNQHVLMEISAFGGLGGGAIGLVNPVFRSYEFFGVAVFVTAYHILGGYTSLLVRTRASQAVKKLLSLQPATARVVRNGAETEVPTGEVQKGDLVRVRPGEQVPVDGVVVEGASAVNESLVTGEPLPREKLPGHEVIGGSVNQSGALLVRVTRVGEESFLEQVARHIQEARALKPGILLLLDRVLKAFVPAVLAVGLAAFVFWTLGASLHGGAPEWERAVLAALAVLVMGYPCALGMATPLAMIRGGGEAARQGILMRSAASFQAFKDVSVVVMDKTGTITHGEPRVVDVVPAAGGDEARLLSLAASAEQVSEHPLGEAIVKAAKAKGLRLDRAETFEAVAGKGVRAMVGGAAVLVGTLRFPYHIARRTYAKTVQNLCLAFSFNGIGVPLATTGLVMPVWAMVAMAASVTTVLLNSFWGRLVPGLRGAAAKLEQVTLTVPSIHCQGCVTTIRDELVKLPAVVAGDGDPESRQVVVTMRDGHGQRAAIEDAIARVGHVVGGT